MIVRIDDWIDVTKSWKNQKQKICQFSQKKRARSSSASGSIVVWCYRSSSLGHIILFISVTRTDGYRKDELTIKFFFSVPLHKISQAAQGYSIMAHRTFHKSSSMSGSATSSHKRQEKFQLFVFHCQSIRGIYYFSARLESYKTHFRYPWHRHPNHFFHIFSFQTFFIPTIEWKSVSSNTTEANALNNDLALFFLLPYRSLINKIWYILHKTFFPSFLSFSFSSPQKYLFPHDGT